MAARGWRLSSTAFEFAKKNCHHYTTYVPLHAGASRATRLSSWPRARRGRLPSDACAARMAARGGGGVFVPPFSACAPPQPCHPPPPERILVYTFGSCSDVQTRLRKGN